jgi:hypothetical protein
MKTKTTATCLFVLLALSVSTVRADRQQIPLAPRIGKLPIQQPLSLTAVLYLSPQTKQFVYRSPDYIPWRGIRTLDSLRPFEIAVGQAFAAAAFEALAQAAPGLAMVEEVPPARGRQLLIEASLEKVSLDLTYYTFDIRPPQSNLLEVGGFLEAALRLTQEGKPAWRKTYRADIPGDRILLNPWTGEQIAGKVADAVASLVREMALEMAAGPEEPALPLDQWLKSPTGK